MINALYMRHGIHLHFCANFIKFAYVVINNVYYVISRNIMFNTNSQVTVVRYIYCYISIRLNLISKVIIY